jgi:hypothetical protein
MYLLLCRQRAHQCGSQQCCSASINGGRIEAIGGTDIILRFLGVEADAANQLVYLVLGCLQDVGNGQAMVLEILHGLGSHLKSARNSRC